MAEKFLVIDHLKVSYEGLFNASELYNLIATWFFTKGWDWKETINMERVTSEGKQMHQVHEPWKSVSNYYKIFMRITLNMADVKDIEVEHEGQMIRMNQGKVNIIIDGYVLADRDHVWTDNTFKWFFTIMSQKYFFQKHFSKFETWIKGDVEDLHGRIKRFLHNYRYTYQS